MRSMALQRSTVALLFLTGLASEAAGLDGCAHHQLDATPGAGEVARAEGTTHGSSSHGSSSHETLPEGSSPHEQTPPSSSSRHDHGEEGAPCCCVDQCVCAFDSSGERTSAIRLGEPAERSSPEPVDAAGTTRRAPPYLQPPANAPPLL